MRIIFLYKINIDKAYLFGLVIGGGILHGDTLQIILPYKKWGNLQINPSRAGDIAEDILSRLNPIWETHFDMNVSYKVGTDWKIIGKMTPKFKDDLKIIGLPCSGELRLLSNLIYLRKYLSTLEHKKSFITGLVDTIGSLSASHRRFGSDFQIISFEFKGNNFELVKDVIEILQEMDCMPDQVLWNHPNQHSGTCRYYKSWKKGFKIRVALDDYLLTGGFLFESKQLSAIENQSLQAQGTKTTKNKPIKISGRVALHQDESSQWLPDSVRSFHFIHNLHFYNVLGIHHPNESLIVKFVENIEEYFCAFTCLTKGTHDELVSIINEEDYLQKSRFHYIDLDLAILLTNEASSLIYGNNSKSGFPLNYILQGIAYIIAASNNSGIKGKRVLGKYMDLLMQQAHECHGIKIGIPNRGTCLFITNYRYAALIGYVDNEFNKKLISKVDENKVRIIEPKFEDCIEL